MGPGAGEYSHAPDERIAVGQVEAAVAAYGKIAKRWLS
jgi:acetylornithine deacetylase/succinyl-diaminopimelate desuccinylase-like protein